MTLTISKEIIKKPIFWIAIFALLAGLGGGGFLAYKYRTQILGASTSVSPDTTLPASGQLTTDQTQKLIAQVGKIIDLPVGETPTVATITDITKLSSQPFFKSAQNGDQVLIYTNAKKAYLYSPTLNRILDVEPINVNATPSATLAPTSEPTPTLKPTPTVKPTPKIASPSATLAPTP